MIKVENFPNAYKEVYVILQYMSKEDVNKISKEFINMLKQKMNKKHQFTYNPDLEFEEQNLLRETKAVFAYIFLNFWANDKQRKIIQERYRKDLIEEEKKKSINYPSVDIFNSKVKKTENIEYGKLEVYKEANIFTKVISRLKKLKK